MTVRSKWSETTVGAEFDIQLGKMLDGAQDEGDLKRYIGNRAVQWGRIDLDASGLVPLNKREQGRFRLRVGDLLVCEGGEVGRAAIWNHESVECYYQKALHRLRPRRGYEARVMKALLELRASSDGFADFVTQTSIAHLPREKFLQLPIPSIPLGEQRRIAEVLEDADSLIVSLERLITKKQATKQGMMQQLLTGKTRLSGFSNPWRAITLNEVATFSKGSGLPKSEIIVGGSAPCIHYGELFLNYGVEIANVVSSTNRVDLPVRSRRLDVLMPTSDVTPRGLAKASAVLASGVILGGDILIIRAEDSTAYGPFLAWVIRNDPSQVLQLVRGSTVFHLYASDMKNFSFPAPTVEEQKAICDVLGDADTELTQLESRLQKAEAVKQGMVQELLTGRTRLVSAEVAA